MQRVHIIIDDNMYSLIEGEHFIEGIQIKVTMKVESLVIENFYTA